MKYTINQGNALIVGASQGIGLGFVRKLLQEDLSAKIYATYRHRQSAAELLTLASEYPQRICCLAVDVTDEGQIAQASAYIRQEVGQLHLAVNCAGILHEGSLQPEKSLKHINPAHLLRYFEVNSISSLLLAKHLLPLFRHSQTSLLAAISAKVGSSGDNQLGG